MRFISAHIVPVIAFACVLFSGCGDRSKVIPPSVMSDIYFEIFVMDQWISDHLELREAADTSLVYEPIFRKYGYTTADYDRSVTYYLSQPEKYLKIAEVTAKRFSDKIDRISALKKEVSEAELANRIFQHYPKKDFDNDSIRWSFGVMRNKVDSILTENKWIIIQENTDTLRTDGQKESSSPELQED